MLPKRKLIKKRRIRQRQTTIEQSVAEPENILQKLISNQASLKSESLSILANLCHIKCSQFDVQIVKTLVNLLYQSNNTFVYECLFAISNLCENDIQFVQKFFDFGLDKGLIQLKATNNELLKPVLILMLTICDHLPKQFRYLISGVENSLSQKQIDGTNGDLVLQFFNRIQSSNLKQQIYTKIYSIFQKTDNYKQKSLCLSILLRNSQIYQKIESQLFEYIQEVFQFNLTEEYNLNIKKSNKIPTKEIETDMMEEQQNIEPMKEGEIIKNQKQNGNYTMFLNCIQGVQILMEGLLGVMEEDWEDQFGSDQDEEEIPSKQIKEEGKPNNLKPLILSYFTKKPQKLIGYTNLPFLQGLNISHLSLRLLSYLPVTQKEQVFKIVLKSIYTLISLEPPSEIYIESLLISLHLLLRNFTKGVANEILIDIGTNGLLKISQQYKQCWVCLLQLYSLTFNPQKQKVTPQQNANIGNILKNLLINIPHIELEQWRGQVIDTIFDVYSNQMFDKNFVQFGFVNLLEFIIKNSKGGKKKKKFIRDVLSDIQRFLNYKKEMIKF